MAGICPLKRLIMVETRKLVREIEAFLLIAGMAETTFGRKAVNDGKLLGRLRAGGSVTLEKASQIRAFMALPLPPDTLTSRICPEAVLP